MSDLHVMIIAINIAIIIMCIHIIILNRATMRRIEHAERMRIERENRDNAHTYHRSWIWEMPVYDDDDE